ncbi:hypothetical protein TeGR_g8597, partial [Tetraparma gracilis]
AGRSLHNLAPFAASWLRGLKPGLEAKAPAPSPPTPLSILNDARVLESSQSCLARRSSSWRYFFERCLENQETAAASPDSPVPASVFSAYASGPTPDSFATCLAYNSALAEHLAKLSNALTILASLNALSGPKNRAAKTSNEFRAAAYKATSKVLATYPIPVTVDCLEIPDPKKKDEEHKRKNALRMDSKKRKFARNLQNVTSPTNRKPDGKIVGAQSQTSAHSLPSLPPSAPPASSSSGGALPSPTMSNQYLVASPARKFNERGSKGGKVPELIVCGGSVRERLITAILHYYPKFYPSSTLRHALPAGARLSYAGDPDWGRDQAMLQDPQIVAAIAFRKIWGVGASTAAKLVFWGLGSIEELRADKEVLGCLNYQQRIGVKRYEDIDARIPREECTGIKDYVASVVAELSDGAVTCTACGSYRRGAESSGDVDILMVPCKENPDNMAAVRLFAAVLEKLTQRGFLTDHLTMPNQFGENERAATHSQSYMGVCLLPQSSAAHSGVHRRIDLKAYPKAQGAFALLYFTGDAHFNRSLRAFCKRAGLTLSDGGLSLCGRRNGSRRWVGRSAACDEEGDVFDALGIGHVRPEFRDGRKGAGAGGGEEQRGYWDDGLVDVDEESGY